MTGQFNLNYNQVNLNQEQQHHFLANISQPISNAATGFTSAGPVSVQKLLSDARKLCAKLKDCDSSSDRLLAEAQTLQNKVDSIKEYHEDMASLSTAAHQRPRSSLILTIQRESKLLRRLEEENKELKCALDEHKYALELIMSKYRQQITQLIKLKEAEKSRTTSDPQVETIKQALDSQLNKMNEMAAVMKKAAEVEDQEAYKQEQIISQLRAENQGLRNMLAIANKFGSIPEFNKPTEDKEVQTYDGDTNNNKAALTDHDESSSDMNDSQETIFHPETKH